MAKFSDLVSAAATADATVSDDLSKLKKDQTASGAAHIAVVSALLAGTRSATTRVARDRLRMELESFAFLSA